MTQALTLLAESLATQDVKHCFGIVGIPVIELGYALQGAGINYYGCRNEQGAAYSAGAVGYLTNRPGLCLAVSGPGMTNCISGLANAFTNCWPMILLSGSSDLSQTGYGAFQEWDQVEAAKPYVKMSIRITDTTQIPFLVEKAVRTALCGRPGPVYIDLPGDILLSAVNMDKVKHYPKFDSIPMAITPVDNVRKAIALLKSAKKPLVVIGKGAAYANASSQLTEFINKTNLPFLPTPMGKGVVSDFHPSCVSPARSKALGDADVIFLVGARLNWILHFGQPPRFQKNVKLIQLDISPEELGNIVKADVPLYGNCDLIIDQFNEVLGKEPWKFEQKEWWTILHNKIKANQLASVDLMNDKEIPLQYYSAYHIIQQTLPKDIILIGEGANTMDIGRTFMMHDKPRHRLDAGTFGTMGIGMPFALAAKAVNPEKLVVAIVGDSAFGFSAMEIETATRYKLPFIVIILNNNGIYTGVETIEDDAKINDIVPTALNPKTSYEKMATAFGGHGIIARTHNELRDAINLAVKNKNMLTVIHVPIQPSGAKKPQEHAWLTRDEPKSKL